MFNEKEREEYIQAYMLDLHPENKNQWKEIDKYYSKTHKIGFPTGKDTAAKVTGALSKEVDLKSTNLKRHEIRSNFLKTIVQATASMVFSGGIKVTKSGTPNEEWQKFYKKHQQDLQLLTNYMSRYGGAWLHIVPNDPFRNFFYYKPHVARTIYEPEDEQTPNAVMSVVDVYKPGSIRKRDIRERIIQWYEWDDERKRVHYHRYIAESSNTPEEDIQRARTDLTYMPMVFVPNRKEDNIYEASDVYEGLPLFQSFDDIQSNFKKALEDEAFRIIFFAGIDGSQVAEWMKEASPLNFYYGKNEVGKDQPSLQSISPSDLRQYIEALRSIVKTIVTVTRTSPLELDERPVQDIPAQTLQVLYGPQKERSTITAQNLGEALSQHAKAVETSNADELEVELKPKLPVAEEKYINQAVSLLQAGVFDPIEILKSLGKTEAEANLIYNRALKHQRSLNQIKVDGEVEVVAKEAELMPKASPVTTPR